MKVQLFIPCFVDQLYPDTGMNMVKVLEKLDVSVSYNPNQTCCGQPAYNAGYVDECTAVSNKFMADFKGVDYIVSPSGSCTGFIRNTYEELFANNKIDEAKSLIPRVYEISEFLIDILKVKNVGAHLRGKATYHDACGALRECGIKQGPRTLLQQVNGLELIEMNDCETCCGFGGTFAVKFEPISIGMAQSKVQNALAVGADYIISTDVSCLMHLDGYIKKNKLPIKTMHLIDVLASN
jgi:L-lactate dehydrogenase complex protein LldE